MEGWISLHRKLLEWEWYSESGTLHLFLHLLLKANHRDKNWRGVLIKRGQYLTSIDSLSKELPLSPQQIRTRLERLKSTSEITIKTSSKNTIITITKYENYQDDNKQSNKQITNEQQTNNKQITTTNNVNNDNNEIRDIYAQVLGRKVLSIPPARQKLIKVFLKEYTIEQWQSGLQKVKMSNFLQSEWTNWGIDWLLNPKNFTKVLEGNYDKKENITKLNQPKARPPLTDEQKREIGIL